ncbi:hypothetical protein MYX06_04220 [Patescibacteria group bacterium AH-259-L05]|nr:hypothetical protein [Patescibacteria group bacterium AH-259-L05]
MKWSPILHGIAAVAGILGVLALFRFWIASASGGIFLGITAEHAHDDAVALLLASAAFGIATLIHRQQEKQ